MKRLLLTCIVLAMTGCASGQQALRLPHAAEATNHPIRPIQIDCQFGMNMMYQLENIIANPTISDHYWDPLFQQVAGSNTPVQRRASAKYILWSIRTQCQGY